MPSSDTATTGKKGGKKNTRFIPPTVEEVAAYCRERGNSVNAEKWWAFYASKGWMVGKNKMADWQAAILSWEKLKKQKPAQVYRRVVRADNAQIMNDEQARRFEEELNDASK